MESIRALIILVCFVYGITLGIIIFEWICDKFSASKLGKRVARIYDCVTTSITLCWRRNLRNIYTRLTLKDTNTEAKCNSTQELFDSLPSRKVAETALYTAEGIPSKAESREATVPPDNLTVPAISVVESFSKSQTLAPTIQPPALAEPVPMSVSADPSPKASPVVQTPPTDPTQAIVMETLVVEPTLDSPPVVVVNPLEPELPSGLPSGDLSAINNTPPTTAKTEQVKKETSKTKTSKPQQAETPIETLLTK